MRIVSYSKFPSSQVANVLKKISTLKQSRQDPGRKLRGLISELRVSNPERTTARMTRFRPCIDLHAGSVKQIVGGTLSTVAADLKTNFTSEHPASYYAQLYKRHNLSGAHVIMLGPGNEEAAIQALSAWKGGMQVGGGITEKNAAEWIERGAEKVSCGCACICDIGMLETPEQGLEATAMAHSVEMGAC